MRNVVTFVVVFVNDGPLSLDVPGALLYDWLFYGTRVVDAVYIIHCVT